MRAGKARLQRRLLDHPSAYLFCRRAYGLGRYLLRRPHEADFACFAHFRDRDGLFLDVGANSGASALSFRMFHRKSPILSLEPNPFHEKDLKLLARFVPRFSYMICGAGEKNERRTLYVPVYREVPLTGEASLIRESISGSWTLAQLGEEPADEEFGVIEVPVEIRRLDDLRLSPDFVKIDVEGSELSILRGLRCTLEAHEPILLIEAASHATEIREFLSPLGYDAFTYRPAEDRLVPHVNEPTTNLFFIPRGTTFTSMTDAAVA